MSHLPSYFLVASHRSTVEDKFYVSIWQFLCIYKATPIAQINHRPRLRNTPNNVYFLNLKYGLKRDRFKVGGLYSNYFYGDWLKEDTISLRWSFDSMEYVGEDIFLAILINNNSKYLKL